MYFERRDTENQQLASSAYILQVVLPLVDNLGDRFIYKKK